MIDSRELTCVVVEDTDLAIRGAQGEGVFGVVTREASTRCLRGESDEVEDMHAGGPVLSRTNALETTQSTTLGQHAARR